MKSSNSFEFVPQNDSIVFITKILEISHLFLIQKTWKRKKHSILDTLTTKVLSLMLELQNRPIPGQYMALFPFLLSPQLWERPGSIPPLTRLIQAYIEKNPDGVKDSITSILGIFQVNAVLTSN